MDENDLETLLVEDNPNDVGLRCTHSKKPRRQSHSGCARWRPGSRFYFRCRRDINNNPRVVLLDLKLPKVDGIEVLRRLKADPRTRAIPVVGLTFSREESDIVESYKLGVNSYIVKPVDFQQFTEAVRTIGLYWVLLNQPPAL